MSPPGPDPGVPPARTVPGVPPPHRRPGNCSPRSSRPTRGPRPACAGDSSTGWPSSNRSTRPSGPSPRPGRRGRVPKVPPASSRPVRADDLDQPRSAAQRFRLLDMLEAKRPDRRTAAARALLDWPEPEVARAVLRAYLRGRVDVLPATATLDLLAHPEDHTTAHSGEGGGRRSRRRGTDRPRGAARAGPALGGAAARGRPPPARPADRRVVGTRLVRCARGGPHHAAPRSRRRPGPPARATRRGGRPRAARPADRRGAAPDPRADQGRASAAYRRPR